MKNENTDAALDSEYIKNAYELFSKNIFQDEKELWRSPLIKTVMKQKNPSVILIIVGVFFVLVMLILTYYIPALLASLFIAVGVSGFKTVVTGSCYAVTDRKILAYSDDEYREVYFENIRNLQLYNVCYTTGSIFLNWLMTMYLP